MSDPFFPTDVRVNAPKDADKELLGLARRVLFHALNMQKSGVAAPITVVERSPGGAVITARIGNGYKDVSISTPTTISEVRRQPEVLPEPAGFSAAATMLSGWTMRATVSGGSLYAFHPTANCAQAYGIPYQWQTTRKLATSPVQLQLVKPSMYSGTMKVVVQALLGMGRINDDSPPYLTAPPPGPRQALVPYGYMHTRTHGVYKAGEKNHWLVEISSDRGVLAMPLPLLANTKTPEFYSRVKARGDLGTKLILDEFGGLPSGEDIPSGVKLDNAIVDGRVLRLATASQLEPYYTGVAWFPGSGWAFSASGSRARNTCWRVAALDDRCYAGYINWNYSNAYRFSSTYWGEHWEVRLQLSEHNVLEPVVGTGSFEIAMLDRGRIEPFAITAFFPSTHGAPPHTDKINSRAFGSTSPTAFSVWAPRVAPFVDASKNIDVGRMRYGVGYLWRTNREKIEYEQWGCTLVSFFDGDRPESLRWIPRTVNSSLDAYDVGDPGEFVGSSVRLLSPAGTTMGGAAITPNFCREGYLLWGSRYGASKKPESVVAYYSGVGVVAYYPSTYGSYTLTIRDNTLLWWTSGDPVRSWLTSYGQLGAAVNAGPDAQFFSHNGPKTWPVWRGSFGIPAVPANEMASGGMPPVPADVLPHEINFVGGHPKGTA